MVKNLLKNGADLLFQQQKTILSGAAVIAIMILASTVLGLIKMRLYAGILGVGADFDTFVAAFKIPDVIFQLVIAGSLNAAFIPIFAEYIGKEEASSAWRFASSVLNLSLLLFASLSAIAFIFARPLSLLVAAGFTPNQTETLIFLTRIMLLSPILLGVSSFISGSIQSFQRFFVPFLSPIFYNLGAIFGILILYKPLGLPGLAWGVVLGSLLHLLIQLPLLFRLGFRYHLRFNFRDKLLGQMVRLSIPRTLGLAAEQIKAIVTINLASLLASGSISILRFAESIQSVPVSIFGLAIAQASLPAFSQEVGRKNQGRFNEVFLNSFHQILYLVVPASIVLIVLKIPVVRLVLGIGKFDWEATVLTSWALALFALSLFAQATNPLIIRAFYALKDTKTPLMASAASVIVGLIAAVGLMLIWQVKGLILGVTLGSMLEFVLLLLFLNQRLKLKVEELILPILKIFFAGLVMAVTIYVPVKVLDQVFLDTTRVVNLIILVWLVLTLGGSTYLGLTWFLGCKEIRVFFKVMLRLRSFKDAITSVKEITPPSQAQLSEELF